MNPPFPFPNPSSFTFLPQNPNPNPSPFSLTPNPSFSASNPAPYDLSTALSTLKSLINLSETTLESLSPALLHSTSLNDAVLSPCPFNPHHRVPPESLFRHSLQCHSTSAEIDPSSLLDSLLYPKTLRTNAEEPERSRFVQDQYDSGAELCFALDGYADFASNFFYQDCPGVVGSWDEDRGPNRTFTLPGVLLAECANFGHSGDGEYIGFGRESPRLLPSELWAIRGEIELWNEYPSSYSYCVLQVVLHSPMVKASDLGSWVISNSPLYGIVIDVSMRDHILLLFSLCVKAIVREATGLGEMFVNRELKRHVLELDVKIMDFRCPILVEVLMWLTSQLSVLYGEVNAKLFIVSLLKKWLLNSASELLLFSSEKCLNGMKKEHEKDQVSEQGNIMGQSAYSREISVPRIAAAVAALHERSLLEEKIKGLQFSHLSTSYQRMAEHEHFSKRADDERQKRSNYRPILEHDGLLWHRSKNQETGKSKTREELLAEERDYKRRRMSYRGKKLKRTTTQVMRDIIDEYMDEIKQAGGIGCFVKGAEFSSKEFSTRRVTTDTDATRQKARFEDISSKDFDKQKRNSHGHDRHQENNSSISRDRQDREHYSNSPEWRRSHGHLHELNNHQRERDGVGKTRSKHHEFNRTSSNYHGSRSFSSSSYSVSNSAMGNGNQELESTGRHRRSMHRSSRSCSVIQNPFDDRYDPAESPDMYEDDVSIGRK